MTLQLLGSFIGGIGLFLLGMRLMSDGLRMAAGDALRRILAQGTRTSWRGFLSGVTITSLVQSSSAVTVATIGFVNAGLLNQLQTIYVIYGSNIGTTMTGWLVALVGFKVSVQALALPLIGAGGLLRLLGRGNRSMGLGEALSGFGLFFLGIDVLKNAFGGIGDSLPLHEWAADGNVLLFVGIGFMLTFLMQSSSAAMAVTLTAAASGAIPLEAAAATVIGANVGTTSTAALAVIGATSSAQRTAAAHVLFNVITAVVALLLLSPLLTVVDSLGQWVDSGTGVATTLALFHTTFNLLGVALLWPFTVSLVRHLERRFRSREEDMERPRFLDKTLVGTPSLALNALTMEVQRIGGLAHSLAAGVISSEGESPQRVVVEHRIVERLAEQVIAFTAQVQRQDLPESISSSLPVVLRVSRYYLEVAELSEQMLRLQQGGADVAPEALAQTLADFRGQCVRLLGSADTEAEDFSLTVLEEGLASIEAEYQTLKLQLLRAGSQGTLKVRQMVSLLDQYSVLRRLIEQAAKGGRYLQELREVLRHSEAGDSPVEAG